MSTQDRQRLIRLELAQILRNRSFQRLMAILMILMTIAAWNTNQYIKAKEAEVTTQQALVAENDARLVAEIDSLNRGLATYENSYTLPSNGVRLTYNNHRVATLPFKPFSLVALGQSDLYSNYKKIVLYFNSSYERATEELVSPLEQLFGQLDLTFVWVYVLPLIILLISFNVLSLERETGRLPLIASQPISVYHWLLMKIGVRFLAIFTVLTAFTLLLLMVFRVDLLGNLSGLGQLLITLLLYSGFWFLLSLAINLAGYSSGKSLILLTSTWVFFVFLIPSSVNLLGKELISIPPRLEIVNHHQSMYNEMEGNLDLELQKLFQKHPDWRSDDPVTSDLSNPTGWNINYLAKQYIAQIKHQPKVMLYERQVETRNRWVEGLSFLSPAMIAQSTLLHIAGTSARHYRSFLKQAQEYAHQYRLYVFKGLFTNHAFSAEEVKNLTAFEFDTDQVEETFQRDMAILFFYLGIMILGCIVMARKSQKIK